MKKQVCEFFSEGDIKSSTVFAVDQFNQPKYWLVERIDRSVTPHDFSVVFCLHEQEAMNAAREYVKDIL